MTTTDDSLTPLDIEFEGPFHPEKSGIKATDFRTGKEFFFYDMVQSYAEDAMLLMGYGNCDYGFSFFKDRVAPIDNASGRDDQGVPIRES